MHRTDIIPNVLQWNANGFVLIKLQTWHPTFLFRPVDTSLGIEFVHLFLRHGLTAATGRRDPFPS
jgi:hypothetical protein